MSASTMLKNAYEAVNQNTRDRFIEQVNLKYSHALPLVDQFLGLINSTNPATFAFMSQADKEQLKTELEVALLMIDTQIAVDKKMSRKRNLSDLQDSKTRCQKLIALLSNQDAQDLQHFFESYCTPSTGFFKHFIKDQWLVKKLKGFPNNKIQTITDIYNEINQRRLHYIWAGRAGLTGLAIASLDEKFLHAASAKKAIVAPRPFEVNLSWILYAIRFANHFALFGKHSIPNPFMTEDEKKMNFWRRVFNEFNHRKYSLLNDSVWGLGNFLCALILIGPVLGPAGDILTIVLLGFDLALTLVRLGETLLQCYSLRKGYLQAKKDADPVLLNMLEKQYQQAKREMKYQLAYAGIDVTYALALLIAFTLMVTPFMPFLGVPAAAIIPIALTGAFLCFGFTVLYNLASNGLGVVKCGHELNDLVKERNTQLAIFSNPESLEAMKLAYLAILKLDQQIKFQKRMTFYQGVKTLRGTVVDSLVPVVLFASLVMMPLGAGIPCIALAIIAALVSKLAVDLLKPKQNNFMPKFDQQGFAAMQNKKISKDNYNRFFICNTRTIPQAEATLLPYTEAVSCA